MLFTVGHRESYEQYFAEQDQPEKMGRVSGYYADGSDYPGGSVYMTAGEAMDAAPAGYAVYGLRTSIDNTYELDGNRHLVNDADLVKIENV
jgi:hypothetical protein